MTHHHWYDHAHHETGGLRDTGTFVTQVNTIDGDDSFLTVTSGLDWVLVAIMAGRHNLYPYAPDHYNTFTGDPNNPGDLGTPIDPTYAVSRLSIGVADTPLGPANHYAYLYLVRNTSGVVQFVPSDGYTTSQFNVAAVGINAADFDFAAPIVTPFEGTDHTITPTDVAAHSGLWLLAGYPASDYLQPAVCTTRQPFAGTAEGARPQIIVGDAGVTPLETVWDLDDPGNLGVLFVELLGSIPADPVPPPPTTLVTTSFNAFTDGLVGATYSLPIVDVTTSFAADVVMPSANREWRAVLVDAAGVVQHQMPDVTIGDIVETLNDITSAKVTIPLRSPAGSAIDEATQFAALEVQVWRGPVLWLWGPIVDPDVNGDTMVLTVKDAPWHLTQRHIGQPGNAFGGHQPYFHTPMTNIRFESGDTSGWSMIRTITIGEFPGFDVIEPGAVVVDPARKIPSGEAMVRCTASLDPLDNYQLFQDLTVTPPQNRRSIRMTLSGWWYIPSDGGFAPNNQRMGLLLATLVDDANIPNDYYRPTDWSFTTLDDNTPRDTLFYQECTLDVPPSTGPGDTVTVHAAITFPQGVSYVGGIDLQADDGLLYDESPSTIGAGLVIHAQDPDFGRDDVNLDWWANTIGDREVREYQFGDHTNLYTALSSLAREGWFDWFTTYTSSTRVMNFEARRRGTYRPKARIRATDGGPSNVAGIFRRRTTGHTAIAAQTRSREWGNHERAAVDPDPPLVLEDVFVGERDPRDYDLGALARERLSLAGRPEVVTVTTHTGDERFLLGMQVGDTTDITSTVPGALASGRYRLTARTVEPARDACELTFNPEATP